MKIYRIKSNALDDTKVYAEIESDILLAIRTGFDYCMEETGPGEYDVLVDFIDNESPEAIIEVNRFSGIIDIKEYILSR